MENMHKKIKGKELLLDILFDIAGSILYAIGIYTFAKTADFAPGGLSGLALIMNHLWGLPIGITNLALNIPLVILSFKLVGKRFLIKTARTMIFCTLFLDVIFPNTPLYTGSPFMAALYSGVCIGAGMALFYMRGSSSGGTDFLTVSIKTLRPHLSLGAVTMAIDLLIILLGWPVFGNVDAVLYGLASAFVTSVVIDKIMYGMGAGKLIFIITTKAHEVSARIDEISGRGSTIVKAIGSYTKEEKQIILCACSQSQAYSVRSVAHEIDEDAFVMVMETSEVFGEGFIDTRNKEKEGEIS
ncbi:MAG: YitT family protein [Candidatus Ruminococcus intestinipullorum]|nr:YitT family protein [Candidatus Ruminococcus intestinipullorum]